MLDNLKSVDAAAEQPSGLLAGAMNLLRRIRNSLSSIPLAAGINSAEKRAVIRDYREQIGKQVIQPGVNYKDAQFALLNSLLHQYFPDEMEDENQAPVIRTHFAQELGLVPMIG